MLRTFKPRRLPLPLMNLNLFSLRHTSSSSVPASKQKYIPSSGTYPKGFLIGSSRVGVKPSSDKSRPDLVLIASEKPASAAAVFTKNKFPAAPVLVSKEILNVSGGDGVRGVVINSGCANAVTGKGGIEDAWGMSNEASRCLGGEGKENDKKKGEVLVMSTGVIGQRLPISTILTGIPKVHSSLGNTHDHWLQGSWGICTTDTFPKLLSRTFTLPSSPNTTYSIAGMTKGAGMIHPNMATCLGVICTDVSISPDPLREALTAAVERSYNSISVDGDTSTNDTVALLANGAAAAGGGKGIVGEDYEAFSKVLTGFTSDLAKLVVRDGEGATKFITVRVIGSSDYAAGKLIASAVARSMLVKTAMYGKDANWGRILCAVGYSLTDSEFDNKGIIIPERTSVSFIPADGSEELKLLVKGEPAGVDEERAAEILKMEDLEILVDLGGGGGGKEEAVYWTCDLSHEYVTINGDYRT